MSNYKTKTDKFGTKYYYLNNKLHREDGPAVEYASGAKEWYKNGEIHREDGPAIELADGRKFWYKNNKLHREDGHAFEWLESKTWYLNAKCYGINDESWIKFVKTLIFS